MNLQDVPTTLYQPPTSSSGLNTTGAQDASQPLLVTTLVCDPQFKLLPAAVNKFPSGSLIANAQPGSPVVKNIPVAAANAIFSESLLFAVSTREVYGDQSLVNNIAKILFLTNPSFDVETQPAEPLSIDQINVQMNKVLLSSAKAYLSGYQPDENNLTFPSFKTISTDAVEIYEQLVLAASEPFLIALIGVDGVLFLLMLILVARVRADHIRTFDLENIVKALRLH
jgi:hypothetical protein